MRTLSDEDIARIADAVAARLHAPLVPRLGVSLAEVQAMLGAPSRKAAQRRIRKLGLKPYTRGNYRLRDIENAIARRTHGHGR